jgi:hypothetical protein
VCRFVLSIEVLGHVVTPVKTIGLPSLGQASLHFTRVLGSPFPSCVLLAMHVHTWGNVLEPSVRLGVLPGARQNLSVAPLAPSCNPTTIRNIPFCSSPFGSP